LTKYVEIYQKAEEPYRNKFASEEEFKEAEYYYKTYNNINIEFLKNNPNIEKDMESYTNYIMQILQAYKSLGMTKSDGSIDQDKSKEAKDAFLEYKDKKEKVDQEHDTKNLMKDAQIYLTKSIDDIADGKETMKTIEVSVRYSSYLQDLDVLDTEFQNN